MPDPGLFSVGILSGAERQVSFVASVEIETGQLILFLLFM